MQGHAEAKEMGTCEGIRKTLDISFPSTVCRRPALPVGLGMWRVLMFPPQGLCSCTCVCTQIHTCTNFMKSKSRVVVQWSSPTCGHRLGDAGAVKDSSLFTVGSRLSQKADATQCVDES